MFVPGTQIGIPERDRIEYYRFLFGGPDDQKNCSVTTWSRFINWWFL